MKNKLPESVRAFNTKYHRGWWFFCQIFHYDEFVDEKADKVPNFGKIAKDVSLFMIKMINTDKFKILRDHYDGQLFFTQHKDPGFNVEHWMETKRVLIGCIVDKVMKSQYGEKIWINFLTSLNKKTTLVQGD